MSTTALFAYQIKDILKMRGWTSVDVAARWGISVTWMSRLINDPLQRPAMYDDAIRGLPQRNTVTVNRQARHKRKRKVVEKFEMFPLGRIWQAENNHFLDEGSLVIVRQHNSVEKLVELQVKGSDETFWLSEGDLCSHFADTTKLESELITHISL